MGLMIDSEEIGRLAEELVILTGETVEAAVTQALRERLQRQRDVEAVLERVRRIQDEYLALPVVDPRTDDEILGYDENGLPT